MQLNQTTLKTNEGTAKLAELMTKPYDFGLVFGSKSFFFNPEIKKMFSASKTPIIGCTTAGEISSKGLLDDGLVVTTCKFDSKTEIKTARATVSGDSRKAGIELGNQLKGSGLKLVFVLGTGTNVNGSDLIRGIESVIGKDVAVTGGLAGDNGAFKETFTMLNGDCGDATIVALGFYGGSFKLGYGSQGGWKPFGPPRKVTRAEGNILYELDGQPALSVYENYLGDKAKELPASGLLYPFAIEAGDKPETGLIRTILGIDKAKGSLTLAGDVPPGCSLRLMHTGNEGLIEGAEGAAEMTQDKVGDEKSGLAILVSCVGRKIVMGQDTEEEFDAVKDVLPGQSTYTGFYSYGEICPFEKTSSPMLHNQTMTITFLTE